MKRLEKERRERVVFARLFLKALRFRRGVDDAVTKGHTIGERGAVVAGSRADW